MKVILLLALSFGLFSCSKKDDLKKTTVTTRNAESLKVEASAKSATAGKSDRCGFVNDESEKNLKITGYKFENKTGVSGTFKKWDLSTAAVSESLSELLMSSKIEIFEESLEFGKPARNVNILKGLLKNIPGEQIKANVKKVELDKKVAMVELIWGDKTHNVDMAFSYIENILTLKGSVDLLDLGFSKAFKALSKLCKVHHMKNGVSKTWSTVDIEISSKVINTCS